MKKYFYCILWIALSIGSMAYAKTITYPTLTENGKTYYLYTVQKSQGLYSISQHFGVPQALILEANPGVEADGLKLGQLIKVPKMPANNVQKQNVKLGKDQHVVKAKETLYGLSKKYNCTVDELLALNPWATHLTIGSVLQLPAKNTNVATTPSQNSSELTQPTDTTGQAKEVNPKKKTTKKNIWSWFKKEKKTTDSTQVAVIDTINLEQQADTVPTEWWAKQKESEIKVGILLPFMLDSVKRDASMDRFVEFYQGCLLAIDSLSKQGLSTKIFTYDIGTDAVTLQNALRQPALQQVDLIIGPAYQNQVEMVAQYAAKHKIPTVIPFSSNVPGIHNNPYLFEVVTPQKELYSNLVQKFCYYFNDKEIILIKPRMLAQHNKADFSTQLMNEMNQLALPYTVISDDSLAKEIDSIAALTTKECLVVMPSTHGVALNKLGEAMEIIRQKNVTFFGFPEWNNLGIDELYSQKMIQFSNYQTDFSDPQIVAFFTNMRNKYGLPKNIQQSPNFALFGFDISYFFLQQYSLNGKHFAKFLPETESKGMQMNFLFTQVENGGYWNVGTIFQQITANGIENM